MDLFAQILGGAVRGRDHPEAARRGDRGRELRASHEGHAGLADRVADPEAIAERRVQGTTRHAAMLAHLEERVGAEGGS